MRIICEHVCFKAYRAHLCHHGGAHGLVAGQGTELVHFVFQQKGVLAAALQDNAVAAPSGKVVPCAFARSIISIFLRT